MPAFRRAFAHFTLRWFKVRALWRKMNAAIERHDFLDGRRAEIDSVSAGVRKPAKQGAMV
jgi:hypothetical protein